MNRYLISSISSGVSKVQRQQQRTQKLYCSVVNGCGGGVNTRFGYGNGGTNSMMVTSYQERSALMNGSSVQLRYNFITDFFQNYKSLINETPEYRKNIDDFKLLFGIKPKPPVTDADQQQKNNEGYTGPKMDFGTGQQQQQTTTDGQQQQQQQGQEGAAADGQQQQQQQGQQQEQKKYSSKEEELRDKYKEYYKDYEKRQKEADVMSKIKGEITPDQKLQLENAYKETLGVRPPYPPFQPTNYELISTDLRSQAFVDRLKLPLYYDTRMNLADMTEEAIDAADDDHLPDLIIMLKQREQEFREKGMDPPEVDWDSMTSVEQFDELPDMYKDSFAPTEEELAKLEELKLPIPVEKDAMYWKIQNHQKWLDRLVKVTEYLPTLGGNYFYFYLNKFSQMITSDPTTKFYMDYKDILLPGFELTKFLEISKQIFIPEFLKLFLVGNVEEMDTYCSETGLKIVSGFIKAREEGHKVLDGQLLSLENFEFQGIRQTEDDELLFVFRMHVISTHCIRDYLYNIVQGGGPHSESIYL
ncbi:hypothetical protein PPL_06347 [Heterostelium album PN500]|uniref:Tim44-like domain-containing protein n=1 Tax=Heterostelium pallidum (strain ATCC 26659 / Pp 5 / PN500) TaxID=670386 RepID=D3BCW9_HETP5|nr:hypothetical protein PPL_06347 [Heterostelium album PN500]EFA80761.1 hypothetical protein PPL_06347 [Heterostelium album PN500]|eukprot:XP_020432880.1 hypothetical protein PPL_06347 [Heterostelium album PN500]